MKKILISFIVLTCVIMACRQFVRENRQEEHIAVLENMVMDLQSRLLAASDSTLSLSAEPPLPQKPLAHVVYVDTAKRKAEVRKETVVERAFKTSDGSQKFSNPILLELNLVDSATLVRVPGIGEKSATIIIRYREQLGGFYSPRQLSEKLTWEDAQRRMDEWCAAWFTADARYIRKLNVNTADFKQLLRHPYLEYNQVKALVGYREKHSSIPSLEALRMLEEFSEGEIERLTPYLIF